MKKKSIFLSHSGSDSIATLEIANRLYRVLGSDTLFRIEFFNTSDQRFRFKDIKDILLAGSNFKQEYEKWESELKIYLEKNLLIADAYLLLVTKRDLLENSEWILFEMELAKTEAHKRGTPFFFPCLYKGASYSQLPGIAQTFHAADLNSEDGFLKFGIQLCEFLK